MTPGQRWALALAGASTFIIVLDTSVVATVLGTIRRDLHASVASLEWVVNAYVLAFAVLLLTGAALGDRLGRRRMLVAGLAIFAASSAACALAPGTGTLIAARAAEGVGAALIMPLSLTQVTAAFPAEQRGRALGIFTGSLGLATLSGPVVGGIIAQDFSWRWIFWINVPIGLAVAALLVLRIPDSRGPGGRLDLGGVLLATAGTFGVVWALIQATSDGWGSVAVAGPLAGGVAVVAAFVGWERRAPAPMLPMRFFAARPFSLANAANVAMNASMYGLLFFLAQYLQVVHGYDALRAGLGMLPWMATLLVVAPFAGNLADRFGERRFLVTGLLLEAAGAAWVALAAGHGSPYALLVPALVISGTGISMAMPAAQRAAMGAVRPAEIGQASGAFSMLRQLGGVLGIAMVVSVFARRGGYASAAAFTRGFGPAIGTAALLALLGAAAAVSLPRSRPVPPPALPDTAPALQHQGSH
jgi:EmrB/QacA subfamily drug resistance transporter